MSLNLSKIYNFTYRLSGSPDIAEVLTEKAILMHSAYYAANNAADNNDIWLLKRAWKEFFKDYGNFKVKGVDLIHQALLSLPPEQRCAVILRDILGYSYEQIGTVLNKSNSEAGNLISRGRQKITKYGKIPNFST